MSEDVTYTPDADTPPQLAVVFLHGLGADGHDLIVLRTSYAPLLPPAVFIAPHAPQPCDMAPTGRQWFSLRSHDPADMAREIQAAAPDLLRKLERILKRFGLAVSQLLVIGFSQGAMMALHSLPQLPKACAGIIGFSGALIGGPSWSETVKSTPPVCLIHGDQDAVVPHDAMAHAREGLAQANIPAEAHSIPGLGHGINEAAIAKSQAFVRRAFKL